nr:chromosome partitioning protein [Actinoplanes friuliensis]
MPEQRTGPETTSSTPRPAPAVPLTTYQPALTPRQSPENGDADNSGAVYRAGPVGPDTPRTIGPPPNPALPNQQQTGAGQAGTQQPTPPNAGPVPPGPQPTPPGPQQNGAQQATPPNAGPAQPGPQHVGQQQPGPTPPGPQQSGPQPGPQQAGPQQPGPVAPGPHQAGPQAPGPQQPGPVPPGPHQAGPPQPGPQQPGPVPPGPQQPGPQQQPGPVPPGPNSPGPQQTGPQQPGPNRPGPQQAGPQQPGPQQAGPQQPGPQQAGPQQAGPQQAGPQQAGPVPPGPVNQGRPGPMPPHPGPPGPWPNNQPPWMMEGQAPHPLPPGPYPPSVDQRAVPPHPHVQQPNTGEQGQPGPSVDPYQQLPWVSDGTPTAEEFARRRLAKPAEPTATMGARAMLQKGTMGLVRLAPGKREQEYKQDVEMVRRNFGGLRQVTVVNPKGGAGKTVAVLLLAMTFGQKRGGYVLAWDNNETQGTLGMRAQQDFHARTVRDMMRDLQLFRGSHGRVGDLSQYVRAQGEGMFDVLASDESATAGEMLTASAFAEIREIVSRFYKLIFVDTGNNVRAQNWQAAMDATDQLVITMSARNDSAETAARMLDHLEQSGRQRLVRQAVSVVTMPPTRKDIDLPAIERHFAARTRAVLLAPYEKLIDSGEPLRYGHLSSGTRDSWLKIAAAVAEGL